MKIRALLAIATLIGGLYALEHTSQKPAEKEALLSDTQIGLRKAP